MIPIRDFDQDDNYLIYGNKEGNCKERLQLKNMTNIRKTGIISINLKRRR